jgi:hypothetical protein
MTLKANYLWDCSPRVWAHWLGEMNISVNVHYYELLNRLWCCTSHLFPILLLSSSFCIDSGSRWGGLADFLPSSISCCNSITFTWENYIKRAGWLAFDSWLGQEFFPFPLYPNQLWVHRDPYLVDKEILSLAVKWTVHKAKCKNV